MAPLEVEVDEEKVLDEEDSEELTVVEVIEDGGGEERGDLGGLKGVGGRLD